MLVVVVASIQKRCAGVAVGRVLEGVAGWFFGRRARSHDGAGSAVLVAFGVLDREGDARGLGESFVHAAVLHCGALCDEALVRYALRGWICLARARHNVPRYRNALTFSATARPCL